MGMWIGVLEMYDYLYVFRKLHGIKKQYICTNMCLTFRNLQRYPLHNKHQHSFGCDLTVASNLAKSINAISTNVTIADIVKAKLF